MKKPDGVISEEFLKFISEGREILVDLMTRYSSENKGITTTEMINFTINVYSGMMLNNFITIVISGEGEEIKCIDEIIDLLNEAMYEIHTDLERNIKKLHASTQYTKHTMQ